MPTITFLCKSDDPNGQQKSEYRKINAQDYKPENTKNENLPKGFGPEPNQPKGFGPEPTQ